MVVNLVQLTENDLCILANIAFKVCRGGGGGGGGGNELYTNLLKSYITDSEATLH